MGATVSPAGASTCVQAIRYHEVMLALALAKDEV